MDTITIDQAITNIGNALAHPSLKLSQQEHLILLESYETIKKALIEKQDLASKEKLKKD